MIEGTHWRVEGEMKRESKRKRARGLNMMRELTNARWSSVLSHYY